MYFLEVLYFSYTEYFSSFQNAINTFYNFNVLDLITILSSGQALRSRTKPFIK